MEDLKIRAWIHGSGKPKMIHHNDIDAIEWCNDKLWHHNGKYVLLGNVILMQSVGMQDINLVDVYEGDIVKYARDKNAKEYICAVSYNKKFGAFWLNTNSDSGFAFLGHQQVIEVLGNIYENKNLL